MNFLIKVAVNAVALWVAAWLLPGISFGDGKFGSKFATVLLVALVFGLVNAFMLQLTEWIADPLGLSFTIDEFFWDAVLGAIIITIVSMVLGWVIPDADDD